MRLQVFLSHSGVCSRRRALELVQLGKVKVNGSVVREPSCPVNSNKDVVALDNKSVSLKQKVYILMNKPKGVTTTKKDRFADKTVMDLLPIEYGHLFPVGRLDKDTTGLLILTNDGDFSQSLTHPSFKIDKIYIGNLNKKLTESHRNQLQAGVKLDDGLTAPCRVSILEGKKVKIIIHEGRKRQIKRMFAALKYRVIDLRRVSLGDLRLGDLPLGRWRELSQKELDRLKSTKK